MCLLRLNYTVQHPGGCEGQQNNMLLNKLETSYLDCYELVCNVSEAL